MKKVLMKQLYVLAPRLFLCLGMIFIFSVQPVALPAASVTNEAQESIGERVEIAVFGRQIALNGRLFSAVQDDDLLKVKVLISQGASPNYQTVFGWTPLMLAASRGSLDILRELLAAGAHNSINSEQGDRKVTALSLAVERESSIKIVHLLLDAGASVSTRYRHESPLYVSACRGDVEVVSALLLAQAGMDRTDQNENVVTMMAFNRGLYNIVDKHIVDGADLYVTNSKGLTIFDIAQTSRQQAVLGKAIQKRNQIRAFKRQMLESHLEEIRSLVDIVLNYDSANGAGVMQAGLESKEVQMQKIYEQSRKGKASMIKSKLVSVGSTALRRLRNVINVEEVQ